MLDLVLVVGASVMALIAIIIAITLRPSGIAGRWQGGREVDLSTVARKYEGALLGLTRVTIVVPRIEDPSENAALRAAVLANFRREVRYVFIVSYDRFEAEQGGYYQLFRNYARDALSDIYEDDTLANRLVDELVTIVPMQDEWPHHPYIFYHCIVGPKRYTFAVRGLERNQGITDQYLTVPSEEAAAIYSAVVQSIHPEYTRLLHRQPLSVKPADFERAPESPETDGTESGSSRIAGRIGEA